MTLGIKYINFFLSRKNKVLNIIYSLGHQRNLTLIKIVCSQGYSLSMIKAKLSRTLSQDLGLDPWVLSPTGINQQKFRGLLQKNILFEMYFHFFFSFSELMLKKPQFTTNEHEIGQVTMKYLRSAPDSQVWWKETQIS